MTARLFVVVTALATSTLLAAPFAPPAQAIAVGPAAFTSAATVIDFDSLPVGTLVDTEYSGSGVVFSSPSGPGGVVTFYAPGQVLSVASSITATFSVPVHRVGLDYSSISSLSLALYDASNNLMESVVNSSLSGFLGLQAGQFVAKAVIHDSGYGFAIDNFRFEDPVAVPEPPTLLLLGSAALIGGLIWRKFRRT